MKLRSTAFRTAVMLMLAGLPATAKSDDCLPANRDTVFNAIASNHGWELDEGTVDSFISGVNVRRDLESSEGSVMLGTLSYRHDRMDHEDYLTLNALGPGPSDFALRVKLPDGTEKAIDLGDSEIKDRSGAISFAVTLVNGVDSSVLNDFEDAQSLIVEFRGKKEGHAEFSLNGLSEIRAKAIECFGDYGSRS